jgi:hypothetical protein
MDVRITSVAWDASTTHLAAATDPIERSLRDGISAQYGPELDLLFVVVSVSDDPAENQGFVRAHTKLGQYERWPYGEKRQLWSLAVEFPRTEFEAQTIDQMRASIAASIRNAVSSPARKPPSHSSIRHFEMTRWRRFTPSDLVSAMGRKQT